MDEIAPDLSLGRRFLHAITERDWESLERCFAPDAVFRAVVPSQKPFREHRGGAAAASQVSAWFKDAAVHEVLESDVEVIADRIRVRYRVRNHEPEGWFLVEQQAFLTPGPRGIEACNLICSGFRPIAAPDTKGNPGPS
jgi:hypothetical protein